MLQNTIKLAQALADKANRVFRVYETRAEDGRGFLIPDFFPVRKPPTGCKSKAVMVAVVRPDPSKPRRRKEIRRARRKRQLRRGW
jgi:hypothetical protein